MECPECHFGTRPPLAFPIYTVQDCRPEQRVRWQKIRGLERQKREREERDAVVLRWKERKRMKWEDRDADQ